MGLIVGRPAPVVEKIECDKKKGNRKMEKFTILFVLVILALGLACSSANGEEQADGDDKWDVTFSPYFWFPDADFTSTMSGVSSDIKVSFKDVLDYFDELDLLAFTGRFEASKGDWGLFVDGQYVDVGYDERFTSPDVFDLDVSVRDNILDLGAAYKLFESPLEDEGSRMLTFAPLGGVRYHYLRQETTLGPIELGGDEEWVEPFIGVLLTYDLINNLATGIRADYGGFGIGSASDHTWNFLVGADWKFRKNMSLWLAYRIYDIDYSRHSGNEEFGMDGQLKGPTLGLKIYF
jgi:opacity protein-like surface antigen